MTEPLGQPMPEPATGEGTLSAAPPRRSRPGAYALAGALGLVVVEVIAIVVGSQQQWLTATVLAWAVIVLTAVTFVVGLLAVIRRWGAGSRDSRYGIAAMIVSLVANPLVLVAVLGVLGGR